MRGRMMEMPLLVSSLVEHASRVHGHQGIISRSVEGPIHRSTWGEVATPSKKLASALARFGLTFVHGAFLVRYTHHKHRKPQNARSWGFPM